MEEAVEDQLDGSDQLVDSDSTRGHHGSHDHTYKGNTQAE